MRLSDYRKMRMLHHAGLTGDRQPSRVLMAAVDADVAAAEAAEVVWEPEPKPLPDRLTLFEDLCLGAQYGAVEGRGWA